MSAIEDINNLGRLGRMDEGGGKVQLKIWCPIKKKRLKKPLFYL